MSQVEPMMMNDGEKKAYAEVTYCFLCKKALGKDRVRHHSHTSGAYLGACNSLCNMHCRRATHIPVFFHNLKGYDSHHIVQTLGKYQTEKLKFIATSSEKLMSITLRPLRILDSPVPEFVLAEFSQESSGLMFQRRNKIHEDVYRFYRKV